MTLIDRDDDGFRPKLTARREAVSVRSPRFSFISWTLEQLSPRRRFGRFGPATLIRSSVSDPTRRRVATKVQTVLHGTAAARSVGQHLRYIEREGAGASGERCELFTAETDKADRFVFARLCTEDERHYRLVLGPEEGTEIDDMRSYCRDVMQRVGADLDGQLTWIAGAHHDTGRPHLHLLVRGRGEDGRSLRIPREYQMYGLRERAEDVVTERLGPKLERATGRTIRLNRFTRLDRLILDAASDGRLDIADIDAAARNDVLRRLHHLERNG